MRHTFIGQSESNLHYNEEETQNCKRNNDNQIQKSIIMKNIKWMKKPPVLRNTDSKLFSNLKNNNLMKKPKLFIDPVDYMNIHGCCQTTAQRKLAQLRKQYGVPPRKPIPIQIYCRHFDVEIEDVRRHFA
ncbi:MAG: hypothetical protein ABS44_10980 [Chryseobacterium sp. SCN 40-13]|nr:MAG: hypothetical protein ABS44_10980 [Chryseobacterium sp. SCN 40-13]